MAERERISANSDGQAEPIDDGRVRVLDRQEISQYDGETIDEMGERYEKDNAASFHRIHITSTKEMSLPLKLLLGAVAVAVIFFLVFVALPLGFMLAAVGILAWFLRDWWQKYVG